MGSGRRGSQLPEAFDTDRLARMPEIMRGLKGEPRLCRRTDDSFQTNRHLGCHAALGRHNVMESLPTYAEGFGQDRFRHAERREGVLSKDFARVNRLDGRVALAHPLGFPSDSPNSPRQPHLGRLLTKQTSIANSYRPTQHNGLFPGP